MNWYYVDAGQQAGPVDDEQLWTFQRSGKILPETLVWHEGMANWQPLREVQPDSSGAPATFAATSPSAGEAVCAECGRVFNTQEMIAYGGVQVCAGCKPVFVQKLAEGVQPKLAPGVLQYGGFWIRFAAKLIDGLILLAILIVPMFLVMFRTMRAGPPAQVPLWPQILIQLSFYAVNAAYTIFFLGRFGATPGKMACGLRVVTADGGNVTYLRATGRYFAEILSSVICNIGYIIAAFDDEKRALHDHICNTRVVYKRQ
jgi:uncharacterized RDD family membrane protein YckC